MGLERKENISGCFSVECNDDNTAYKIYVEVDETRLDFNCFSRGEKLIGNNNKFKIFCQDPAKICKKQTSCPNDCYFR